MAGVRAWIVPWYREQDWPDWCTACKFQGSHKDWLSRAEAGAKEAERVGHNVAKVIIEPSKFVEWCGVSGRKIDGEARVAYAITLFDQRSEN